MVDPSQLFEKYLEALTTGLPQAPVEEQPLYSMHVEALRSLKVMFANGISTQDVLALIARERRAFGWSFLSGAFGAEVERAFNALATELERQ